MQPTGSYSSGRKEEGGKGGLGCLVPLMCPGAGGGAAAPSPLGALHCVQGLAD